MASVVQPRTARRRTTARYWELRLAQPLLKHLLLILAGFLFFFPFAWLVLTSLKSVQEIFQFPPTILPQHVELGNYAKAVTAIPFLQYLKNTLVITFTKIVGSVISCSLVAYGFSRLNWPGREPIFVLVLATMMLPFQVTMIPLYIIFDRIHWIGTYYPLIIPSWFASAYFVFMLRQFFRTIPPELSEAARIDGCSEPRIYWQIIMPLAQPALATLVLFQFMWTWNDFFGPLLYINNPKYWTLALGLLQFRSSHEVAWEQLMAASTLITIPSVILYFIGQKTFIQGIATTGFR